VSDQTPTTENNMSIQIDVPHDVASVGDRVIGPKSKRRRPKNDSAAVRALENLSSLFEQMLFEQSEFKLQIADLQSKFLTAPASETTPNPTGWEVRESQLMAEIDRLHKEILSIAENVQNSAAGEDLEHRIRLLENALQSSEQTTDELAEENRQLRHQISALSTAAGRKAPTATSSDNLSWDERKKLLMQELDGETSSVVNDDISIADPDALAHLIQSSQIEIERRDREIEELKKLLTTQSNTISEGVNLEAERSKVLDADEIIQQERSRLQTIQSELDEKLRKAEIDLSLERARLARDRQLVEERQQALKNQIAESDTNTPGVKKRNWLASLGLDNK
jgi:chromosome segregation ATPase